MAISAGGTALGSDVPNSVAPSMHRFSLAVLKRKEPVDPALVDVAIHYDRIDKAIFVFRKTPTQFEGLKDQILGLGNFQF